jgi:hypothetical protein
MPKVVEAFERAMEASMTSVEKIMVWLKIRDVGVIQNFCCETVSEYRWSGLVNVNLEQ